MSNTMREILFRGKRTDNGKWVQGLPADNINGRISKIDFYDGLTDCEIAEVIPETVGQFTGLTDKNDNKIFEGDIVKHYNHKSNMSLFDIGLVFWDVNKCRFARTSKSGDSIYEIRRSCMNDYEIINNIHDNPELLEKSNA